MEEGHWEGGKVFFAHPIHLMGARQVKRQAPSFQAASWIWAVPSSSRVKVDPSGSSGRGWRPSGPV